MVCLSRCWSTTVLDSVARPWTSGRTGIASVDFITPGSTQNPCVESNGKIRDECLNEHLFSSMADARRTPELSRRDYNTIRPHSGLNNLAPAQFAAQHHKPRQAPIGDTRDNHITLMTVGPNYGGRLRGVRTGTSTRTNPASPYVPLPVQSLGQFQPLSHLLRASTWRVLSLNNS